MKRTDSQITGALAEDEVKLLFLQWGWNHGVYRIDRGYDLFVTLDEGSRDRSFFVQVKGTVRGEKGVVSAPVSTKRLRQYAEASHPVVLIRSMGGNLFWLDAQRWCAEHEDRLTGTGYRAVRFERQNVLADRTPFEAFLQQAFLTTASRQVEDMTGSRTLDRRISALLSQATGSSAASAGPGATERSPVPEEVELQVRFLADNNEANRKRLREAVALGLPRTVDVKDFCIARGTANAPIGPMSGQMTLSSNNIQPAQLLLYPGTKPSITALPLLLTAERFQGMQYGAYSNERLASIYNFAMAPGMRFPEAPDIDITFGVREDVLVKTPLRQIHELAPLAEWAEQMLSKGDAHIEITGFDNSAPITLPTAFVDHFAGVIKMSWALGRLHAVTRVLRSDFSLPANFQLTEGSWDEISFAYRLLRGDRITATPGPIEFEPAVGFDLTKHYEMRITTNIVIAVSGREVGRIPAVVELHGFQVTAVADTGQLRLDGGTDGRALVYYSEHGDEDSMTRVPPPDADA